MCVAEEIKIRVISYVYVCRCYFSSSKWVPGGPGDVPHQERHFLHPDGPQLGKFWNKQSCVAFDKLKLTNSRKPSQRDQVCSIFESTLTLYTIAT